MVSMGNVWDRTTEFLGDNLGKILPVALLAIFVPAVIGGNFTDLRQGAAPGLAATLGIGSLLLSLISFWGQLAITAFALDAGHGRAATGLATRRFPAALLVVVVILLLALVALLPIGVILAAGGADLSAMTAETMPTIPPAAALGTGLYLLILVPVVLWLGARLSVILPVVVGEGLALRALTRSWRLTRGAALRIVGVLILYAVVSIIANLAATTAFGAVMYLVAGPGGNGLSLASVLTTIVGGAVSTAFSVLGAAFTAKLFLALLLRQEAARPQ